MSEFSHCLQETIKLDKLWGRGEKKAQSYSKNTQKMFKNPRCSGDNALPPTPTLQTHRLLMWLHRLCKRQM